MDLETFPVTLPNGITLSCRACGPAGAPVLLFVHGFPEAAFVWDELMLHFGRRFRCLAPNLRGYADSSAPAGVEAYRAKLLIGDLSALIDIAGGRVHAVIAHDWGGALAWGLAITQPEKMARLVIINAPHPATFQRDLMNDAEQQAASAYMNELREPDAAERLAANDFALLWEKFTGLGSPGSWLTDAVREQYRAVWRHGLEGALNYYRASPLAPATAADARVAAVRLPREAVTVKVPTLVIWGEADRALRPRLLDGLGDYVPDLRVVRVPEASHWIVHEQPGRVAEAIATAL